MKNTLNEILALTQDMLTQCEHAQWEALTQAEDERKKLLQAIDVKHLASDEKNSSTIQAIISINEKIVELAEKNNRDNEQALITFKRRLKNTSQYRSASQPIK